MPSTSGEFSFHEMEEIKRKLDSAITNGGEPTPTPIPAPSGGVPPVPSLAPSGVPAPLIESQPQEFFSRQSRSDVESLQMKRMLRLFQRHWLIIAFLAMALPGVMYIYDNVLNQSYIPEALRVGARMRYATEMKMERRAAATATEREMTNFDPVEGVNLNQELARDTVGEWIDAALKKQAEAEGQAPAATAAISQYLAAKRGKRDQLGRITIGAARNNQMTVRVEGGDKNVLTSLAGVVVPALNEHFRSQRLEWVKNEIARYKKIQAANELKLAEANMRLRQVSDKLQQEDPAHRQEVTELDVLRAEAYKLRREGKGLQIQLDHGKSKVGYESIRASLQLAEDTDIQEVFIEDNPLRMEWARLRDELARLRPRYKEIHPAIQALVNDIDAIKAQLKREGNVNARGEVFALPTPKQEQALKTIAEMSDRLELNRRMLDRVNLELKEVERKEKERYEAIRKMLASQKVDESMLRTRDKAREDIRLLQAMSLETARPIYELEIIEAEVGSERDFNVTQPAQAVSQVSPKLALDMFVAVVIGLVLGCGVAFLLESMDSYLHTPSDVYYHLRLNYLGVIPYWQEKEQMVIVPEHPDSHIAEVYAHLCNNIRYGRTGSPEQRLLIASALPGEGKSTIAANVAVRYALEGNSVALIDADMRRPRGHKLIDIFEEGQTIEYGLSSYLSGDAGLDNIVYATNVPGLSLIPAGARVRNAAKLIGSQAMTTLLDEAEDRFDILIVDCPAVLPVVDATILAPHMRGILMVIAAEEAEVGAVRMALYRLRHVGAPIAGAVLNKVRERSTSYTYYGYRSRSGYSYSPYGDSYANRPGDEGDEA